MTRVVDFFMLIWLDLVLMQLEIYIILAKKLRGGSKRSSIILDLDCNLKEDVYEKKKLRY